jgi:hypothetical protein
MRYSRIRRARNQKRYAIVLLIVFLILGGVYFLMAGTIGKAISNIITPILKTKVDANQHDELVKVLKEQDLDALCNFIGPYYKFGPPVAGAAIEAGVPYIDINDDYLHPYMWVCKSHYYSADRDFYNFPYAFGLLFAKGVYAEYLRRGEAFVPEYDKLLQATGKNNIADVAKMVNIDIRSIDFWRSSLELIEGDIDRFMGLSEKWCSALS